MITKSVIIQAKENPGAITALGLYFLCWVYLSYLAYMDFTHHGGGETVIMVMAFAIVCLFIPYLMAMFITAWVLKTKRKFYLDLSIIILCSMILGVGVMMTVQGHFN